MADHKCCVYRSVTYHLGITHRPVNLAAGIRVISGGLPYLKTPTTADSNTDAALSRGRRQVSGKLSGLPHESV